MGAWIPSYDCDVDTEWVLSLHLHLRMEPGCCPFSPCSETVLHCRQCARLAVLPGGLVPGEVSRQCQAGHVGGLPTITYGIQLVALADPWHRQALASLQAASDLLTNRLAATQRSC